MRRVAAHLPAVPAIPARGPADTSERSGDTCQRSGDTCLRSCAQPRTVRRIRPNGLGNIHKRLDADTCEGSRQHLPAVPAIPARGPADTSERSGDTWLRFDDTCPRSRRYRRAVRHLPTSTPARPANGPTDTRQRSRGYFRTVPAMPSSDPRVLATHPADSSDPMRREPRESPRMAPGLHPAIAPMAPTHGAAGRERSFAPS